MPWRVVLCLTCPILTPFSCCMPMSCPCPFPSPCQAFVAVDNNTPVDASIITPSHSLLLLTPLSCPLSSLFSPSPRHSGQQHPCRCINHCGLQERPCARCPLTPPLTPSPLLLCHPPCPIRAFVAVDNNTPVDASIIAAFKSDLVHDALAGCASLRPSMDIAVTADADYVREELRHFTGSSCMTKTQAETSAAFEAWFGFFVAGPFIRGGESGVPAGGPMAEEQPEGVAAGAEGGVVGAAAEEAAAVAVKKVESEMASAAGREEVGVGSCGVLKVAGAVEAAAADVASTSAGGAGAAATVEVKEELIAGAECVGGEVAPAAVAEGSGGEVAPATTEGAGGEVAPAKTEGAGGEAAPAATEDIGGEVAPAETEGAGGEAVPAAVAEGAGGEVAPAVVAESAAGEVAPAAEPEGAGGDVAAAGDAAAGAATGAPIPSTESSGDVVEVGAVKKVRKRVVTKKSAGQGQKKLKKCSKRGKEKSEEQLAKEM
ncbi:unnamed protein product [Closterium sp. Naga37s-1]|nr:unnamed protein product [Closterium sp. Naga37s-1]